MLCVRQPARVIVVAGNVPKTAVLAITRKRQAQGSLGAMVALGPRDPVVARHPETGRKVLYVNSGFTSHIKGLRPRESRRILDLLFEHIATTPRLIARVEWQPNTLTFWDNRCTQHHAVWDYYPEIRSGWRVTLTGSKPYFDPDGRTEAPKRGFKQPWSRQAAESA